MSEIYYVGIDVGTGSVRAGLVSRRGRILKVATRPIETWNPKPDYFEQSSDDIWNSCSKVVKEVSECVDKSLIKGICFDATCSLVVIGENGESLSASTTGEKERNVILWMDHRATSEASFVNENRPDVLRYVGGAISPEMQTPKLKWLKQNIPETWSKAKYFFDLSDYLSWRATGDDTRSLCTVVCKWTFVAGPKKHQGWDRDYFSLIDLTDLLEDDAAKIGKEVRSPGEKAGNGLTEAAAKDLGLLPGTAVATSIIDAHAGGLGLLGCKAEDVDSSFTSRLGLICGTSTCHMTLSDVAVSVAGVWGPYFGAMVPGLWLNEAGQSATGKLIDYVIDCHPATKRLEKHLRTKADVYKHLNSVLERLAVCRNLKSLSRLTCKLHVWPDFHGNRSPLADPSLLGMMSGMNLASDEEDLAVKYLAVIQALAYGTKHILERLRSSGHEQLSCILMCGGLSKNEIFVQTHADVLDLPVLLPEESESVLLGAAMLGAVASGGYSTVEDAVTAMAGSANVFRPNRRDERYHLKKYKVFLKMVEDQKSYEAIMKGSF